MNPKLAYIGEGTLWQAEQTAGEAIRAIADQLNLPFANLNEIQTAIARLEAAAERIRENQTRKGRRLLKLVEDMTLSAFYLKQADKRDGAIKTFRRELKKAQECLEWQS